MRALVCHALGVALTAISPAFTPAPTAAQRNARLAYVGNSLRLCAVVLVVGVAFEAGASMIDFEEFSPPLPTATSPFSSNGFTFSTPKRLPAADRAPGVTQPQCIDA